MNKIQLLVIVSTIAAAALVGCGSETGSKSFSAISPGNLVAAISQDNANDSLTVNGAHGAFVVNRTMPGATSTAPVSPALSATQLAAIASDPLASAVLALGQDKASVDLQYSGTGGVVTFRRSMPPNTNSTAPLILTVTNIAPATIITNLVTVPASTNVVTTSTTVVK